MVQICRSICTRDMCQCQCIVEHITHTNVSWRAALQFSPDRESVDEGVSTWPESNVAV